MVRVTLVSSFYQAFSLNLIVLALAVVDYFMGRNLSRISIRRLSLRPLAVRAENEIMLEITNRDNRDAYIRVFDDVPDRCSTRGHPLYVHVPAREIKIAGYGLTPELRGDGLFRDIYFWCQGPMGLVWRRFRASAQTKVKFYPGLDAIKKAGLKMRWPRAHDPMRATWKKGAGGEFDSLRDYSVGDDYRLIHWASTARRGRLTVRQNRVEMSQNLLMILDAGRMMTARDEGLTKLDHALNASINLAAQALELGDRVGVMALAEETITFAPPAKTPGQLARIMESVYAIEPRLEEPRFFVALKTLSAALKKRSLVVIFTDIIDQRASEGLSRLTLSLFPRHLPLVCALRDTDVSKLAQQVPRNPRDLYMAGVAAEALYRRELLISRLRAMGAYAIDTAPSKISSELLDHYLDIKLRGRL
jgi:uncharacterized protein (DUF58 family)